MPDLMWPVTLIPTRSEFKFIDGTARSESPFDGHVRTMIRPGTKTQLSLRFEELRDSDRKLGMATITGLRGASGRLWIHDHTHRIAGAFATSELVPAPTMSSIAGYTAGTSFTAAQVGRIMRLTRNQNTGGSSNIVRIASAATVVAYAPYVGRVMVQSPRGDANLLALHMGTSAFGSEYASLTSQSPGMLKLVAVPLSTSLHFGLVQGSGNLALINDHVDIPFMSLSRCGLVDNAPNALQHSNNLDETAWINTRSSESSGFVATGPDGASSLYSLIEDSTATSTHYLTQAAAKTGVDEDWTARAVVKADTRTQFALWVGEPSNNFIYTIFDISAGTIVSTTQLGTVVNGRAKIVSLGNDIYEIFLTATIPGSITTTNRALFLLASGGAVNYSGNGTSKAYFGWLSYAKSSVPMRHGLTTATTYPDGSLQAVGGGIWSKGWPESINGLFEAGDIVEVGGRKHWVRHRVDTDAAGRAQIFLSPVPRVGPADNEPIIAVQPNGKYMLLAVDPGWLTKPPGFRTDLELELMEAI